MQSEVFYIKLKHCEMLMWPQIPSAGGGGRFFCLKCMWKVISKIWTIRIFPRYSSIYTDIIEKLKHPKDPRRPFRPDVKTIKDAPREIRETVAAAWAESPEERPTFTQIRRKLKALIRGMLVVLSLLGAFFVCNRVTEYESNN